MLQATGASTRGTSSSRRLSETDVSSSRTSRSSDAGAAAMLAIAVRAWPRSRIVARSALTAAVVVTIAAAWLARQNVFEWMFNPLPRPSFVSAGAASFLEPADLVLAVRAGDDAAAYPIRQMAYHHLVNDRIGRTPAVVTY